MPSTNRNSQWGDLVLERSNSKTNARASGAGCEACKKLFRCQWCPSDRARRNMMMTTYVQNASDKPLGRCVTLAESTNHDSRWREETASGIAPRCKERPGRLKQKST